MGLVYLTLPPPDAIRKTAANALSLSAFSARRYCTTRRHTAACHQPLFHAAASQSIPVINPADDRHHMQVAPITNGSSTVR